MTSPPLLSRPEASDVLLWSFCGIVDLPLAGCPIPASSPPHVCRIMCPPPMGAQSLPAALLPSFVEPCTRHWGEPDPTSSPCLGGAMKWQRMGSGRGVSAIHGGEPPLLWLQPCSDSSLFLIELSYKPWCWFQGISITQFH